LEQANSIFMPPDLKVNKAEEPIYFSTNIAVTFLGSLENVTTNTIKITCSIALT
jgi:hypothetical protein